MASAHMAEVDGPAARSASKILLPTAHRQVLHSEPCVALCAEAFMVIEADLEASSPGRAAALGVRGGLAEGERAL